MPQRLIAGGVRIRPGTLVSVGPGSISPDRVKVRREGRTLRISRLVRGIDQAIGRTENGLRTAGLAIAKRTGENHKEPEPQARQGL
jgi:hypothetical protein